MIFMDLGIKIMIIIIIQCFYRSMSRIIGSTIVLLACIYTGMPRSLYNRKETSQFALLDTPRLKS